MIRARARSAEKPRRADLRHVAELTRELAVLRDGESSVIGRVLPGIQALLESDVGSAYALSPQDSRLAVDFSHVVGALPEADQRLARWYERSRPGWGHYDPIRPDPKQRNLALTWSDLERLTGSSASSVAIMPFLREVGIARDDQLRILLCDGPVLLAWVGVFRDRPYGDRERLLLSKLAGPLRERARLDRLLACGAFHLRALEAALESIGSAAFLTSVSGTVAYANSAGRARLESDAASILAGLKEAARGRVDSYSATRVTAVGAPEHVLLVERSRRLEEEAQMTRMAARWALTPRQRDVLRLLARGLPNKTIAGALRCSVRTIDVHVAALLEKANAETRAELVARFWSGR